MEEWHFYSISWISQLQKNDFYECTGNASSFSYNHFDSLKKLMFSVSLFVCFINLPCYISLLLAHLFFGSEINSSAIFLLFFANFLLIIMKDLDFSSFCFKGYCDKTFVAAGGLISKVGFCQCIFTNTIRKTFRIKTALRRKDSVRKDSKT